MLPYILLAIYLVCPYCKKRSYFKKEPKEQGTVEVKVCGHCGDCMNGFD
jgi:uncharacterized protein YbaR (Trm112 family)